MRPKRYGRIMQRYWIAQAKQMASQGHSFLEIKYALPKLNYRGLRAIKPYFGIPIKQAYQHEVEVSANRMAMFHKTGHSIRDIARIFGVSRQLVTYRLKSRGFI